MPIDPTPRSDPEGYLALRKFSRRLAKCPRTGLPVSYADIGDPDGIPVLYLLPSGCSRWLAAAQDPLAKRYGIRLIAMDRPGTGAIPMVPLKDRIRMSCEMMVSVLEHLEVKLLHMIVSSGGIYYALYLLLHHPDIFLHQLNPPPTLYLVAPWSPLLPSTHPDYYSSSFTWIPNTLIETSHITLPHVEKIVNGAYTAWSASSEALGSVRRFTKALWNGEAQETPPEPTEQLTVSQPIPDGLEVPAEAPESETDEVGEDPWKHFSRLWGNYPAIFNETVTEYFTAENQGAVGQEHLQCLNRGQDDTGHQWLENVLDELATALSNAQPKTGKPDGLPIPRPISVHVWWGWQDSMVPRQGQLWFNKVVQSHPKEIHVEIHNIPNGDHGDLMMRRDGVGVVYTIIREQGTQTDRVVHLHPDCTDASR